MNIQEEIDRLEKEMNWAGQLEYLDKEEINKLRKHKVFSDRKDKIKKILDMILDNIKKINKDINTGKPETRRFLQTQKKKKDKAQKQLDELESRTKILKEQLANIRKKREEIKKSIRI